MYISFQELYCGKEGGKPILSPADFEAKEPIVVIRVDTSKQNDTGTFSTINVSIELKLWKI